MAKAYRQGRLGEEIRRIISDMMLREIRDPRVHDNMISITDVDVTSDNSYATVYFTVLGASAGGLRSDESEARKESLEGLRSAAGLFRREIGKKVKIKHVPELIFKVDSSMEYGRHIDEVLKGLEN